MLVDAALTTTNLHEVPAAARAIEAAGYDGIYTFEGPHDALFPLLLAAEHTERVQLDDRGRHRLRPQPDDPRPAGVRPAARVARPLQPRARHADQAAHRETVLDGVVEARGTHARVRASRSGRSGRRGTKAPRLDFRGEFYSHTLMTPFFNPGPNPYGLPRIFLGGRRARDDRGRGRSRRRVHGASVLDRDVHARDDRCPRSTADSRPQRARPVVARDRVPREW